jgi:hypothetical protein
MKTINKKNIDKITHQLSLYNISSERAYIIGKGWNNIKIQESFKNESFKEIVNLLGGTQKTKTKILFNLKNTPVYGWFTERIIFDNHLQRWVYIAGQDCPKEKQEIRNQLKK